MGNHTAVIFPIIDKHPDAIYTAMQTSQLHRMPRMKATDHGKEHFAVAMATLAGPAANVPLCQANHAYNNEPAKFQNTMKSN